MTHTLTIFILKCIMKLFLIAGFIAFIPFIGLIQLVYFIMNIEISFSKKMWEAFIWGWKL